MKKAGIIFPIIFALYVCAVLFCCFWRFESLPEVGRSFLGIPADKVVHFIMFLPWPALAWLAFPRNRGIAAIFLSGCVFAALTEAGQSLTSYREGDTLDLLADILGLTVGCIAIPVIKSHLKCNRR